MNELLRIALFAPLMCLMIGVTVVNLRAKPQTQAPPSTEPDPMNFEDPINDSLTIKTAIRECIDELRECNHTRGHAVEETVFFRAGEALRALESIVEAIRTAEAENVTQRRTIHAQSEALGHWRQFGRPEGSKTDFSRSLDWMESDARRLVDQWNAQYKPGVGVSVKLDDCQTIATTTIGEAVILDGVAIVRVWVRGLVTVFEIERATPDTETEAHR